jgi:pre-mRNA-processing factor 6
MRCRVLKRALEFIPASERLWRELIELSGEGEARILLHKAVECIPTQLEFWLALAKLEDYDNAKSILNKAR